MTCQGPSKKEDNVLELGNKENDTPGNQQPVGRHARRRATRRTVHQGPGNEEDDAPGPVNQDNDMLRPGQHRQKWLLGLARRYINKVLLPNQDSFLR